MSDPLKQLLLRTDAAVSLPAVSSGLIERVQIARKREVSRRRGIARVGLLMLVFAVAGEWMDRQKPVTTVAKTDIALLAKQLQALRIDAALHERTASNLLVAKKTPAVPVFPAQIQFQSDRAALILVYEADRYVREERPADAVASYRRAIELFPRTHWADVARQRLKHMQT